MPESRERTAAEREAARLERERRRVGRDDGVSPQLSTEPEPEPEPEPEAAVPPRLQSVPDPPPVAPSPSFADHPYGDDDYDEVPSGIKRARRPPASPRTRQRRVADSGPDGDRPRHRRRWRIVALIPLVLALALAWFLVELFQPFGGSPHGHITVTIPAHSGADQIGDLLAKQGVISSSFFFGLRATLAGDRGDLRSGTYHLQYGMSYGSVLTALTTAPPAAKVTELTLIPGKSRGQIDTLLHSQGIKGSYLADTRHSRSLNPRSYGAPRDTPMLEGFLFPSTYQLLDPISIPQLVAKQLVAFKQSFKTVNLSYARRHKLTAYDVLIIASMIEGEAATERDRELVSSVIYNRLRDGMPLQLDATTRYAVNNYTEPLTDSQLASRSPYNTRIHTGLPPTPIDNPSLASIQAAAHPAQSNYLYFVVKPCGNGAEVFTGNYQQFLRDSNSYNAARNARGGRSPTHC